MTRDETRPTNQVHHLRGASLPEEPDGPTLMELPPYFIAPWEGRAGTGKDQQRLLPS